MPISFYSCNTDITYKLFLLELAVLVSYQETELDKNVILILISLRNKALIRVASLKLSAKVFQINNEKKNLV